MLERIVSKLLMRYLKDYIEKINSSQMEMAAWQGYVKLQNLSLQEEALMQHMIPFRIIKGTIGLIELKFPWKNLDNEPSEIHISDIYIIFKFEREILIKRDLQPKQAAIKGKAKNQLSSEDEANTWQSIIDSIFDNARVNIQNIHIRFEEPTEFNTIAIGLIIPAITLRSVDQDKNTIQECHGELVTRKRLLIENISFYFDALSDPVEIEDFFRIMRDEMRKNHQFILDPFNIDIVIVHSREKDNPVKNQIDILINSLSINLDYLQSKAIMKLLKDFTMFQRKRSFIHCMRPEVFENTAQLWGYTFRCAVSIMRPYAFKPSLALKILKNRKVFLKRMRESMKTSSISMFQSFKNKRLKQTEDSIGQQATLFLTSYCNAVLSNEAKLESHDNDLTPLEISDIQQINKQNAKFFSKNSFSTSFGMNSINVSLNYSRGTPLFIVKLNAISASYSSLGEEITMYAKLKLMEMTSYADDKPKAVFTVNKTLQNFIEFESISVGKRTVSTDICQIDSFVFRPDYKSINTAIDFFFDDRNKSKKQDQNQTQSIKTVKSYRIFRIDAFDNFKLFLKLCNRKISFKTLPFSIIYPFNHDGKIEELTLTISTIDFWKYGDTFYPSYAPVIKTGMDINITIDNITFSKNTLLHQFLVKTKFLMSFTKANMEIDFNTSVTPISISINHFPIQQFKSFLNSFDLFSIFKAADHIQVQKIISFHKVKMNFSFVIQSIAINFSEMEIDTAFKMSTIELQMNYYKGISTTQIGIGPFEITDNENIILKMEENLKIMLTKESETQPFTLSMNVIQPYVKGDMNWILLLIDIVKMYLSTLNIPINSIDNEKSQPPFHLNILITAPHIDISHDRYAPFVIFKTMHVHDDENFTIFVDISEFQILRRKKEKNLPIQRELSSETVFSLEQLKKKKSFSKYIQVFKPTTFSIMVETKEKIKVSMNLPNIEMHGTQIDYTCILPFISHILEVIPVEQQPTTETTVDMFVESVNLVVCDYDVPTINVNVQKTKIDVLTSLTNISVKLSTGRISIYQMYNDLYPDQNIEDKAILDVNDFNLKYDSGRTDHSGLDTDSIYIEIPPGKFGLSERFLSLVPFFANFNYPPYPLPRKESHIQIIISIQPAVITIFDAFNSYLILNMGSSKVCILTESEHSEMTELDIIMDSLLCKTSLYDENILVINKKIQFAIKEQVFTGHFHKILLTISMKLILDIANFFSPLKECNPIDDETEGIPFDFDVSFEEISLKALTLMKRGPHCLGSIIQPKFVLNFTEKIAAFSVESIIFSSGYQDDFQKKFIEITSIFGFFRFNTKDEDGNKLDNQITYDSVHDLQHHKFTPFDFEDLSIYVHIHGVDLTYTHQMALAIIGCFIPRPDKEEEKDKNSKNQAKKPNSILMINEEDDNKVEEIQNENDIKERELQNDDKIIPMKSKNKSFQTAESSFITDSSMIDSSSDTDESIDISSEDEDASFTKKSKKDKKTKMKMIVSIDSFSLTLSIITPIAFFKISELSIKFDDNKWEAIIKTALIHPSEEHYEKVKIPLFQCPPDKNLIQLQMNDDEIMITFQQATLFFDYNFWIPMISFITQSPFLHIQSIIEEKENAVKESVSIPFKVSLIADKFKVKLPVSLNYETCQILHIEMGYTASFADNVLDASINDLNVHVYDQEKKIDFSPIVQNMSIVITDSRFDENHIRLHAFISPMTIVLSAFDFILLGLISKSFDESIGQLVVSADNSSITPSENQPQKQSTADIHLEIGKMKILIVKDNRSSSRFTPIFKIKNTPINLVMNSSKDISISLGISPYIAYFNDTSGQWDLIIEPLSMNIVLSFSNMNLGIKTIAIKPVNINLPTTAISQFLTLWNEIANNISQKDIVFKKIPMGWFQNNLGSEILVKYSDCDQKQKEVSVKSLETVEIEDIDQNASMIVVIQGEESTILMNYLIYPTIFSKSFSVCRKPHKGGTLIQFNPPIQLVNKLGIDFTLYEKNGEEYKEIQLLKSGKRCPLPFNEGGRPKDFTFTDPKYKNNSNHLIAKISPYDTNTFNITIISQGMKIRCVVFIELEKISKVFKVLPYIIGLNLLPFPLYLKISKKHIVYPASSKLESSSGSGIGHIDDNSDAGVLINNNNAVDTTSNDKYDIITIGANESVALLFIDSATNQFQGSLSVKEGQFASKVSIYKLMKKISAIPVFPDVTIAYKCEPVDDQLKICFFVPCVFYNLCSNNTIKIREATGKQPIEKKIEKDGNHLLWCPQSYITNNDQLSVYVSVNNSESILINCLEFQKGNLFFKSKEVTDLFNGLRYHIVTRQGISVVTFSTLLIVRNEIPFKITLQPLESTPKNFEDDIVTVGIPNTINVGEESAMDLMSEAGSFIIWVDGFWNSPAISLLEQRKIVFKMHRNVPDEIASSIDSEEYMSTLSNFYEVLEVEIFDSATSFIATFRKSNFPTPIVIANTLSNAKIQVYQKIDKSPFIVEPESTSIFAFDEPLGYPNANLIIKGFHFNISLIEDTEQILLKENLKRSRNRKLYEINDDSDQIILGSNSSSSDIINSNDSSDSGFRKSLNNTPIYVKIKQNISGIKTVFISSKKEIPPKGFNLDISAEIPSIFISIIDLKMREFCLLTLSQMKGRLSIKPTGTAFQFELGEFQIDDQNPLAPNPVILHGRRGRTKKAITNDSNEPVEEEASCFLKFDGLLTSDTKPFSSSKYISILMQRIDIQVDSSFLSDAINMSMKLAKPIKIPIHPLKSKKKPAKKDSNDSVVTYNWLEVSPIYMLFIYKNLTGRPTSIAPMFYPMRFIPSIATTKIMFPGIIVAHITDRLDFIIEKVSNDYKTAALEQVLESLGTSGKILTTFGITATIAEKLDIPMKSELTDISTSLQDYQSIKSEEYDNRKDINGYFSQETLSALQSSIKDFNLRSSSTVENVLTMNETNESNKTNNNAPSQQQDLGRLMIRDFPGSGFGHGIVGVLKKTTIDIMPDVKVMGGVDRKRIPRAFPNNRIEKFDEEICTVQTTIQTFGKNFEKILMKTKNNSKGDYVCITESSIYFIPPPLDKVRVKIKIKEIKSIKVEGNSIIIEYGILKKPETITCVDKNEVQCFKKYLDSQKIYSDLFVKSIV